MTGVALESCIAPSIVEDVKRHEPASLTPPRVRLETPYDYPLAYASMQFSMN